MTALFMDGFDHYGSGFTGSTNMTDGVWAEVGFAGGQGFRPAAPGFGPARTGANCLALETINLGCVSRYVVPGFPSKMFVSFGFASTILPGFSTIIFETRSALNVINYYLTLNPTGTVSLNNGSNVTIATTAGPVVRASTWHFFELCVDYDTGTFTLRVDDANASETPALTASISTGLQNAQISFRAETSFGQAQYWDDLFIRDDNGTVNNDWLGDRRVATLNVNADTATAGWTPEYYQKYGTGVLRLANMVPNNNSPVSPNANVRAATATSLDVGNSDFTLESWVRFEKLPDVANYATIFSRWDTANNFRSYRLILGGTSFNNGSLQFDYSTDGTSSGTVTPIVYPFTPDLNHWYHIALVRASDELLLFVDGAQLGLPISCTDTFFAGSAPFAIGAEVQSTNTTVSNTYVTGLYDETRFTNGFARYTSSFTPTGPFPRGGSDPHWAEVVYLAGYDSIIQDESSFARALTANNGAAQFTVNDGAAIGAFSTINKITPDDNTFIQAAFTPATNILTMTTQPSNGDTVTVGTTDGVTPAVYTFKNTITTAYDVLIDTTAQNTLLNLYSAINAGAGAGTKYGTGTLANADVAATQLPVGQIQVTALIAGTSGNSIASTESGSATSWATATLTGGADIPGPSDFKFERPPANTTIISAIQQTVRAYKSDAGLCSIQNALIGPLGGVDTGTTHALAVSPDYYWDIYEEDPDTSAQITPATLLNGKLRINRTV